MTNEEKRKEQRKAEAHRDHPERAVHPDRTHRIRIPYGTAVRKLSGTVFLYQTEYIIIKSSVSGAFVHSTHKGKVTLWLISSQHHLRLVI